MGSHARGIRNTNGDHLFEFLESSNYVASNTFFKHRACHITTWQGEINGKRVYNQIDYILIPFQRKQSMTNARSYHCFSADSDHRLVVTTLYRKNDFERSKLSSPVSKADPVIKEMKRRLIDVRQKLYQSSNIDLTAALKKQRNRLKNVIKKREAFLIEKTMICEADDIMRAKDNAQSALAIKKLFQRPYNKSLVSLSEFTEYFRKQFFSSGAENNMSESQYLSNFPIGFKRLVTVDEVAKARTRLRNNRAPGPDQVTSEDLKREDLVTLTDKLNQMIVENDEILTTGYLAPILKPGKDPKKTDSYRPVILLSTYRKLLSLITISRIENVLEKTLSPSQYAYRANRSAGDVVLAHKFLIAGAYSKGQNITCIGIDMSKAFDTVIRPKLIDILDARGVEPGDIGIIKLLLTNTSLQVKCGKTVGEKFATNIGVPQGDGLSPKLFTLYLDVALREIEERAKFASERDHCYASNWTGLTLHGHDYHKTSTLNPPLHIEYADDVDFFPKNSDNEETIFEIAKTTLKEYNLNVNDPKTEKATYSKTCDLRKIKKLGTVLDEAAEVSRRKQFSGLAMSKYSKIWRNRHISTEKKVQIYNTYVRSILTYNCSTWVSNKTIANSLNAFHRTQLRRCMNIIYPNIIKNDDLYVKTKTEPISDFIKTRRLAHLGHILRRNSPTRDILYHIHHLQSRGRGCPPANLLKTYSADLGSSNIQTWFSLATARRL